MNNLKDRDTLSVSDLAHWSNCEEYIYTCFPKIPLEVLKRIKDRIEQEIQARCIKIEENL